MTRFVRTGAVVVAGLAAALTLTACGSGDDDAGKDAAAGSSASTPPATGGGEGSGESEGKDVDPAALDGTWLGLTDGKSVTLSVSGGKAALVADQSVCEGDVKEMGGEPMLALTCTGGGDRTMGTIESVDDAKLVVSWDGGAKDSLTKAEPGALPSGLPSLPGMPELPDMPDMPEIPAP